MQTPQAELETLKADLFIYFRNKDRLKDTTSYGHLRDEMVRAENRLRDAVGLTMIASKT
jgi:acyl-coenzyme A synthetase/AMP-(fatty) acid ligase